MSEPLILTFAQPSRPMSINEANRLHWAARRRRLEDWGLAAAAAFRHSADRWAVPVPVTVQVGLTFPRAGRRDPHNYTGTNVKVIVDALVREGLVADDVPDWLTVIDPVIRIAPDNTCTIIIERKP